MKDIIYFAHGNGFPSRCYQQLFLALEERYKTYYIDIVGHNPVFPVTDNWDFLVNELILSIRECTNEPVIGIGHSLGGILNLLASIKEPSLFKAVVMIDSPVLNRFKSHVVKLAKKVGVIDYLTPASRTQGRRQEWETKEQLAEYLKRRPLFKTFTEACLQDYINYGCEKTDTGYTLRFNPDVEYKIYRTVPHDLPHHKNKLSVPVALIYGDKSSVIDQFDVRYMSQKYGIPCYEMPGTHLLPMEDPKALAQKIFTVLAAIL